MPRLSNVIDVHSHAVLDIGRQPPLDDIPKWAAEKALGLMDANGIAACVLSIPDAANAEDPKAAETARRVNEALADVVARHPKRFGALASVPGHDMDGALSEMEYALDTLGMDGVSASTSVGDVYLGDPRYDPWFAEMDRRGVTLFVHPVAAEASKPVNLGIDVSLLEFMFDSTRMLVNMVLSGAKGRYPGVKVISTHGGGTIAFLAHRLQVIEPFLGAGKNHTRMDAEQIRNGLASFYYDLTACTSPAQLGALLDLVPASRLLAGFDIPFMSETSIAPAMRELERSTRLTDGDALQIASGTAARLFPRLAARVQG